MTATEMSTNLPEDDFDADAYQREHGGGASGWESAFLTIVMFGGLVIFGVGCVVFDWFG